MTGATDAIWNRAAMEGGGQSPHAGDGALTDLLRLHGRAMNGGVLDAVESIPADALDAAVSGYRFFGLESAADAIEDVRARLEWAQRSLENAEELDHEADLRYNEAIPDETIVEAFVARRAAEPDLFARSSRSEGGSDA